MTRKKVKILTIVFDDPWFCDRCDCYKEFGEYFTEQVDCGY